jgi:hypothetical protein
LAGFLLPRTVKCYSVIYSSSYKVIHKYHCKEHPSCQLSSSMDNFNFSQDSLRLWVVMLPLPPLQLAISCLDRKPVSLTSSERNEHVALIFIAK